MSPGLEIFNIYQLDRFIWIWIWILKIRVYSPSQRFEIHRSFTGFQLTF